MAEPEAAPARRWFWRGLPYLISLVAIVAILVKYPPSVIAREMSRGNLLAMIPFAVLLIGAGIFIVSTSDFLIVSGSTLAPPSFLRTVRARAAVSLLGMLGYGAGVGGYGVWIARASACSARLAVGIALYLMSADLIAVALVASAAIFLGNPDVSRELRVAAPVIAGTLLLLKIASRHGPLPRERLPVAFHPWHLIGPGHALAAVAIRTANILFVTVCVWAGANAFGLRVPLAVMATFYPIVLVVGSMPVNIGGFGAVQGAWLLLEPWADSGEQVIAFSVLWHLLCGGLVALRGLPFLRAVTRELEPTASRSPASGPTTSGPTNN